MVQYRICHPSVTFFVFPASGTGGIDLRSRWWALLVRISKEAVISGHNLSRFLSSNFSDLDYPN